MALPNNKRIESFREIHLCRLKTKGEKYNYVGQDVSRKQFENGNAPLKCAHYSFEHVPSENEIEVGRRMKFELKKLQQTARETDPAVQKLESLLGDLQPGDVVPQCKAKQGLREIMLLAKIVLPFGGKGFVFAKRKEAAVNGKFVRYVKEYFYPNDQGEFPEFVENGKKYWWSPFGLKVEQDSSVTFSEDELGMLYQPKEVRRHDGELDDEAMRKLREERDKMNEETVKQTERKFLLSMEDVTVPVAQKRYFCPRSGGPPMKRVKKMVEMEVQTERNVVNVGVQTTANRARRTILPLYEESPRAFKPLEEHIIPNVDFGGPSVYSSPASSPCNCMNCNPLLSDLFNSLDKTY